LLQRDGAELEACDAVADAEALGPRLREPGADLILVCGGSGDGANDYGAATLARCGRMEFGGIAMNPGETTRLGRVGSALVMLLPGAPLACLYAYEWFAGRAVRRLAGGSGEWPYGTRRALLSRKVASTLGRLEFCRVRLDGDRAEPLAVSDGRLLSSAVRADGFVPVPPSSEGHPEQTEVTVWLHTAT
jgi:molybdopterin molybdotransferase